MRPATPRNDETRERTLPACLAVRANEHARWVRSQESSDQAATTAVSSHRTPKAAANFSPELFTATKIFSPVLNIFKTFASSLSEGLRERKAGGEAGG